MEVCNQLESRWIQFHLTVKLFCDAQEKSLGLMASAML